MKAENVDTAAWRAAERKMLLARREAIEPEERRRFDDRMTAMLLHGFSGAFEGHVVGFYWPMKGEFDPRVAVHRFRERHCRGALPVVVRKAEPLEFREWWPGVETVPGVFNLPVPQGSPLLVPDVVLVPPVGFDSMGYRLGYGGGYFDRTLAALSPQPLKIGVGREASRIHTIHPQPHDIPMDFIVTEKGVHEVTLAGLRLVESTAEVARIAARILDRRRKLPADDVAALLNTLLEAERAGAKVLNVYLEQLPLGTEARALLACVQQDESRNCAVLMGLLRSSGAEVSAATGDFLQKAIAIEGARERLEFLNRGQSWVARRIAAALPHIANGEVREALKRMHDSHIANIAGCDALLEALAPAGS